MESDTFRNDTECGLYSCMRYTCTGTETYIQSHRFIKVYPEDCKLTETPILRKPGKPDYTSTGAWRPIVLSNVYMRLLNSCKMEDLVIMCEKTGILPLNHFIGRPGRATMDSIHLMIKLVKGREK